MQRCRRSQWPALHFMNVGLLSFLMSGYVAFPAAYEYSLPHLSWSVHKIYFPQSHRANTAASHNAPHNREDTDSRFRGPAWRPLYSGRPEDERERWFSRFVQTPWLQKWPDWPHYFSALPQYRRIICASGIPTRSTARLADTATPRACGSALPTSSAAEIIRRRAMNLISSPA